LAFIFFVFAVALGLDAIKSAAWGAICGMGVIGYFVVEVIFKH